ncbi:MAG: ABC transporter permease subunit/CPBP intramembrane protease [Mariniblastus sp.]
MSVENDNSESTNENPVGADQRVGSPPKNKSLSRRPSRFRLSRLTLKELRETLRDRRTIITLVLMPLLVYPALSLVFKTFLLSNIGMLPSDEPIVIRIAYTGDVEKSQLTKVLDQIGAMVGQVENQARKEQEANQPKGDVEGEGGDVPASGSSDGGSTKSSTVDLKNLAGNFSPLDSRGRYAQFYQHQWFYVGDEKDATLEDFVESGEADVGVVFETQERQRWEVGKAKLISRKDPQSQSSADYLFSNFKKLNEFGLKIRLQGNNLPTGPTLGVSEIKIGPEDAATQQGFPLATLVPMILVLMTITGAVYPAIDLTAGERERGTLETLMAAPVPRVGILFSKFLAVLTVAIMTAVLNIVGMFATVWAFQLDKQFGGGVFSFTVMWQILLLLILFAAFYSALLLAVTSFAKSFKEAQVYLIPIILLSLGPGLMAMAPGMSLDGINAVTPMVNILLLARDVIQNNVMLVPAVIAVVSTLFYTYLAIRLAAWIFGSDSILYAGSGSVMEMFQRPVKVNRVVPIMATIFCLVMLFPINFASIGYLGRMSADTNSELEARFLLMALFTFFAFMVVPWLVSLHQNTATKAGFGLTRPKAVFICAAVLLGLSLWPLVMSLTSGWHEAYGFFFGKESQQAWREKLVESTKGQVERIRMVSPYVIVIAFSITPAVCEEWFFRGMFQRSLLSKNSAWKAIVFSSLAFGAFHMLGNSVIAVDRLIPTTLVGLMLGYLAYKSNSIIPGIILHSIHNAFVIFLAYYQPQLMNQSWFPREDEPIPVSWVIVGAIVALVAAVIVWSTPRSEFVEDAGEETTSLAKAV